MSVLDDLLEREHELAELATVVKEVCSGTGHLVVVTGAAGVGKSRLLAAAREHAIAADMVVLAARGLEFERSFPFGVAMQFLESALPAGRLPDLAAGLADGLDHGPALVHRLRELVVCLMRPGTRGEGRPLLLVLDDAGWADPPSLRLLLRLTADLDTLPLGIILAVRDGEPDTGQAAFLDRLASRARVLRPAPLSDHATAIMVLNTYPQAVPRFCAACARLTGGNPFLLRELLAAAWSAGIAATAEGAAGITTLVPGSVLRSVLLRVRRASPDGEALARALAILGDGASLTHVAGLAGLDQQSAENAADALIRNGLLRPDLTLSFSHPLIAAAVRDEMPALARSRAHRHAAELLLAQEANAEEIAVHLAECLPDGSDANAAVLGRAADTVASRGEYPAAKSYLERALAERPQPALRTMLRTQLALVEAATGTPEAITWLTDALETLHDPHQRAVAWRALARLLFARSDSAGAVSALSQALTQLGEGNPMYQELAADQLILAAMRPDLDGGSFARLKEAVLGAQAGELPADPAVAAQVAAWLACTGQPAALVREVAMLAVTAPCLDDAFYGLATGCVVQALIQIDELDLAAPLVTASAARAGSGGSLIRIGFTSHWRAMLQYCRGELAEAVAAAEEALQVCRSGWDVCRPWVTPLLAQAQLERGDLVAARAALRLGEESPPDRPEYALLLQARGQLALASGEPAAALADFEAAGVKAESAAEPSLITMLPWRSAAAMAAAALGRRDYAASLASAELAVARRVGARRGIGVALHAAGLASEGEHGLELLRQATAVLDDSPAQLERARALAQLGAAYRRAGHRQEAREPLRRAAQLAQRLGAAPLATWASQELAVAGGRRRAFREVSGVAALTPAELRVARRAARDLSTPQIAQELSITPKTVEWHLGHAYRKLAIGSRRELRQILDAAQDDHRPSCVGHGEISALGPG